jgi:hypothetical protein
MNGFLPVGVCQEHIIKGYGEMSFTSDGLRKQTLKDIDKCAQVDNYREHHPDQIINSVGNILNGDKTNNPEIATLAYTALKGLTPATSEDAMKMLSALQKIGNSGDRKLQAEMVNDIHGIFKKFDKSEDIQRKCLEIIKPFGEKGIRTAEIRADSFEKIINSKVAAGKTGRPGGYEKPVTRQSNNGNSTAKPNVYQTYKGKSANAL